MESSAVNRITICSNKRYLTLGSSKAKSETWTCRQVVYSGGDPRKLQHGRGSVAEKERKWMKCVQWTKLPPWATELNPAGTSGEK